MSQSTPEGIREGDGDSIFNRQDVIEVGPESLEDLKSRARASPRSRSRLCLHRSVDEDVHEMVIVLCRATFIRPHRHPVGKAESYHVIDGGMDVFLFDDAGKVMRIIKMGAPSAGKTFLYRLMSNLWHMPVVRSEFVIYHETYQGPFRKDRDVEYAGWAPEESDVDGVKRFLKKIDKEA